jgi:ribosomal protein S18 acetylase RimI-like enzyme
MDIKRLGPGDERALDGVGACFDGPVQAAAAMRFLTAEGHHILVAYDSEMAAGFVTGIEMTHPDKGTEMFLYELGVDAPFRRRGYGAALVQALADLARARGCYGMWVLTDSDNAAALATYGAAGAAREPAPALLSWTLGGQDAPVPPEDEEAHAGAPTPEGTAHERHTPLQNDP